MGPCPPHGGHGPGRVPRHPGRRRKVIMKDARALPALLLAAFLALTGCAPVAAGSGGEPAGLGRVAAGSDGAAIASPPASGAARTPMPR